MYWCLTRCQPCCPTWSRASLSFYIINSAVIVVRVHPRTGHEGPQREWRYSSTLSLTSALVGGGWSTPRPGRFTPGKETLYPLYRRLGGPQGRSGRVRKISPPPGFDPLTVQPVASRYTDYAFPAHDCSQKIPKILRIFNSRLGGFCCVRSS